MKPTHVYCIIATICLTVGCSSHYYRVTDPSSGKNYFTKKVDEAGRTGAVKFKDQRTGGHVTLQSSEVKEISEGEYDAGLAAKPASARLETKRLMKKAQQPQIAQAMRDEAAIFARMLAEPAAKEAGRIYAEQAERICPHCGQHLEYPEDAWD